MRLDPEGLAVVFHYSGGKLTRAYGSRCDRCAWEGEIRGVTFVEADYDTLERREQRLQSARDDVAAHLCPGMIGAGDFAREEMLA